MTPPLSTSHQVAEAAVPCVPAVLPIAVLSWRPAHSDSPSIPRGSETQFKSILDDGSATNAKIKLLWIGCGKQEPRFGSNEQFSQLLTSHQIKNTLLGLDGLHNYTLWRKFLIEFAPLLFRTN